MLAMTKQGVRDLGDSRPRQRVNMTLVNCTHRHMRWHCFVNGKPCGHLECPDCGENYDVASDGPYIYADGTILNDPW